MAAVEVAGEGPWVPVRLEFPGLQVALEPLGLLELQVAPVDLYSAYLMPREEIQQKYSGSLEQLQRLLGKVVHKRAIGQT